jgi:hypothetical protein
MIQLEGRSFGLWGESLLFFLQLWWFFIFSSPSYTTMPRRDSVTWVFTSKCYKVHLPVPFQLTPYFLLDQMLNQPLSSRFSIAFFKWWASFSSSSILLAAKTWWNHCYIRSFHSSAPLRGTPPIPNVHIPPCKCWTLMALQVLGRQLVR